jgi:hypothetical protein
MSHENVEIVEAMWRTYGERGFDAALVYSAQYCVAEDHSRERTGLPSQG